MSLEELNRRFGIAGILKFETQGELTLAAVTNRYANAGIALQGAHVARYQPRAANPQQPPLIWLSTDAKFVPGKSIRGGVPVCWPWFGAHKTEAKFPAHGFARTVMWELIETQALPDGRTQLVFELLQDAATRAQWPYASTLRNTIVIGEELEIRLTTTNAGAEPFEIGQALHTYFQVGDIRQATLHGLDGCPYLDKTENFARKQQHGAVAFTQETDRIYLNTHGNCEIRDPALQRSILITSTGSRSTVVWTPWAEKAEKMGDLGKDGYLHMVCVETANAAEDTITLSPGQQHILAVQYRYRAA